ncbi:MAG: winged helix-turn-helix transcriptional regulator [Phyllobacteriaceae bacterium]|jgi:DNA-binding transcriptional ArsR family regulator|nr:winged helix-turn-helix transcriptional regulator [Phyllobacteriaceae bacterium]
MRQNHLPEQAGHCAPAVAPTTLARMLIKRDVLDRIVAGEVDRAFRRWKRPTVKAGGRLRTAVGELAIDDVSVIDIGALTEVDASRAGYRSVDALKADLPAAADRPLYRIALRYKGPDARVAPRDNDDLPDDACAALLDRLDRMDARAKIPQSSLSVLALIKRWPERSAAELAAEIGIDKPSFKRHVRRLKELGLTESLTVGYRLSARGERLLAFAGSKDGG